MEETKIETLEDLNHYYPLWREITNPVVKMLITNKNFTMIPYIIQQVSDVINFEYLAQEFIDDLNILQWLDQMATQYGKKISYNVLVGECLDDPDLFQIMINLAEQKHQPLDLNYLGIMASNNNNIPMLQKFIQMGANEIDSFFRESISNSSVDTFRYLLQMIISTNYSIDYEIIQQEDISCRTNVNIVYELIVHMKNIGQCIDFKELVENLIVSSNSISSNELKQLQLWIIEQMKIGYFPSDVNAVAIMGTDLNMIDLVQYTISNGANCYNDIAIIASKNGSLPIIQLVIEKLIKNNQSVNTPNTHQTGTLDLDIDTLEIDISKNIIISAVSYNHNDMVQFLITFFLNHGKKLDLTDICMGAIKKHNIVLLKWIVDNSINTKYPIDLTRLSIHAVQCDDVPILKYITSTSQQLFELNIIQGKDYKNLLVETGKSISKTSPQTKQYMIELVNELHAKYGTNKNN